MDYSQLVKEYFDEVTVRDFGDFAIVAPPIFFRSYNESLAIRIEKIEGGYRFTDCHCVSDYWEYLGVEEDEYKTEIDRICDLFGLGIDHSEEGRGAIFADVRCESDGAMRHFFGYFIQGVIMLAHVAL